MTIDERLLYLSTLQQSHDDAISRLVEQGHDTDRRIKAMTQGFEVLKERSIQMMDSINRLAHIAASHDERLDDLEGRPPS